MMAWVFHRQRPPRKQRLLKPGWTHQMQKQGWKYQMHQIRGQRGLIRVPLTPPFQYQTLSFRERRLERGRAKMPPKPKIWISFLPTASSLEVAKARFSDSSHRLRHKTCYQRDQQKKEKKKQAAGLEKHEGVFSMWPCVTCLA